MCSLLVPPSWPLLLLSSCLRQASSISWHSVAQRGGDESERGTGGLVTAETKIGAGKSSVESIGTDMEAVGKMRTLI